MTIYMALVALEATSHDQDGECSQPMYYMAEGGYVNKNFEFWAKKLGLELTAMQMYTCTVCFGGGLLFCTSHQECPLHAAILGVSCS